MSSLSPTSDPRPVPAWVYPLALLAVAVGAAAFVLGLHGHDPATAWRGLLINVLFWASLAQGAVVWSAIFRVARTTWSAAVNRVGHAFVRFLPIPLLLARGALPGAGELPPLAARARRRSALVAERALPVHRRRGRAWPCCWC